MSRLTNILWPMLALLCGAVLAQDTAQNIKWAPDIPTARAASLRFNVPLLIHFYGDNCLPCRLLEERVFAKPELIETLNKYFICVQVNASQNRQVAAEYQVHSWPTDVFVSPDGKTLYQGVCQPEFNAYMAVLQNVAVMNRDRNVLLAAQRPTPNQPTQYAPNAGPAPSLAANSNANSNAIPPSAVSQYNPTQALSGQTAGYGQPAGYSQMAASTGPNGPSPNTTPLGSQYQSGLPAHNVQTNGQTPGHYVGNTPARSVALQGTNSPRGVAGGPLTANQQPVSIAQSSNGVDHQIAGASLNQPGVNTNPNATGLPPTQYAGRIQGPTPNHGPGPAQYPNMPQVQTTAVPANAVPASLAQTAANNPATFSLASAQVQRSATEVSNPYYAGAATSQTTPNQSPDLQSAGSQTPSAETNPLSSNTAPSSVAAATANQVTTNQVATDRATAGFAPANPGSAVTPNPALSPGQTPTSPTNARATPVITQPTPDQSSAENASQATALQQDAFVARKREQPAGSTTTAGNESSQDTTTADKPAMGGFCPVALKNNAAWVEGKKDFAVRHRGKVYWLSSAAAQSEFLAAPDSCSPLLAGFDPLVFLETGELKEGSIQYGLRDTESGTYLLFVSPESKAKYWQDAKRLRQALEAFLVH